MRILYLEIYISESINLIKRSIEFLAVRILNLVEKLAVRNPLNRLNRRRKCMRNNMKNIEQDISGDLEN